MIFYIEKVFFCILFVIFFFVCESEIPKAMEKSMEEKWSYFKDDINQYGIITTWYANGQKKTQGEFYNGNYNGLWTSWYEDGQVKMEGQMINGKKNGHWIKRYLNGNKAYEGNYKNGRRIGLWVWWYKDGTKMQSKRYSQ